jgi:lipoprotein NlpD
LNWSLSRAQAQAMKTHSLITAASLSALAAACASGSAAPVDYRGAGQPVQQPAAPRAAPIENRAAETAPPPTLPPSVAPAGDTQQAWEGQGAPLSTWALQPEEAQPYDPRNPEAAHLVAQGETLYTIAARRQVPLRALIDANGLQPPFRLEAGQVLILPPPATHTVAQGETLAAISRRYNIDLRSFVLLNRLEPPYMIRPGDRLVLPAGARAPSPPQPVPAPVSPSTAQTPPGRLAWPVVGEIVAPYGPNGAAGRSEAIEIAADPGAAVRAPADGRVLFAGEGPDALGGLVIIDHGDGLVSTVGFVTGFGVEEGVRVRQGATIALAAADRVLFQVRRAGAPVDPASVLSRR